MLGYLLPPWAFATTPGTTQSTCVTDSDDKDSKGHQHKLEDESIGWSAAAAIATHLSALLDRDRIRDRSATIVAGRYVRADGSLSASPLGTVAVRLANGIVLRRGVFVDFDGQTQPGGPDLSTAGMRVGHRTYYVDVYPAPG
jgi:hypothetical protein